MSVVYNWSPKTAALLLDNVDTAYLDERWLENGRLRRLPAAEFLSVPIDHRRVWMHKQARYLLPTIELLDWLQGRIAGRRAVELGAGNADLGRLLGVTMTDSRVQCRNLDIRSTLEDQRQPYTQPPHDVLTMEANDAAKRLRPRVAIASWLTERFDPRIHDKTSNAFVHGTDDRAIIRRVECYIHIGADHIHGRKSALELPHEEIRLPGIVSRAPEQEMNVIYVWGK